MALLHHQRDAVVDDAVVEEHRTANGAGVNAVLRAIGAIAGGVATVIGVVALLRIDWTSGLDSAPVDVAGMVFTPVVAAATTVLGIAALAAGAARDRSSKLVVGALLGCLGLAILIAGDSRANWDLERGHGWLALAVGAVLLLTGLLLQNLWESRRMSTVAGRS